MAEGQMLFSLDSERFRAALSSLSSKYPNGFSLQQEFKIKGIPLSSKPADLERRIKTDVVAS